jgi:hypothetical protein
LVAIMASMYLDFIEEETPLGSLQVCHENGTYPPIRKT